MTAHFNDSDRGLALTQLAAAHLTAANTPRRVPLPGPKRGNHQLPAADRA